MRRGCRAGRGRTRCQRSRPGSVAHGYGSVTKVPQGATWTSPSWARDSTASRSSSSNGLLGLGDEPQRLRSALSERAFEAETACAAARNDGLARGTRPGAGRHHNAGCAQGRPSRRDPSTPARPRGRTGGPSVPGCGSRSCPPAGRHGRARSSPQPQPCTAPRPEAQSGHPASRRRRSFARRDEDSGRGGCTRALAIPGSRPPPTPPPAPRQSATARATPGNAGRPARPASAAASPPRRGSRTDPASAARAGRVRARRTSRAVGLPRRRAYPGWRLILRAGKGQAVGLPVEVVDEVGDPERRAAARDCRLEPHRDRRSHPVGAVDSALDWDPMKRVRFAPSPTGSLHVGNALSAVANRSLGDWMLLRIDDTDPQRNVPGGEEEIIRDLEWLGLAWEDGPVRQSERQERYREAGAAAGRALRRDHAAPRGRHRDVPPRQRRRRRGLRHHAHRPRLRPSPERGAAPPALPGARRDAARVRAPRPDPRRGRQEAREACAGRDRRIAARRRHPRGSCPPLPRGARHPAARRALRPAAYPAARDRGDRGDERRGACRACRARPSRSYPRCAARAT